jgi:hypothetical protein
MSRPCAQHPNIPIKGGAYAVRADGTRQRLTRQQLRTRSWPADTVEILTGVPGHLSDHAATTSRQVVRLSPGEVVAVTDRKLSAARTLTAAAEPATARFRAGDGKDYQLAVTRWRIGETSVVFGAPDGAAGTQVRHLPRNPYTLTGTDPTSDHGRDIGLRYTAALAAAGAANGCVRCTQLGGHHCASCAGTPIPQLRQQARNLLGPGAPSTTVDALLYAGSTTTDPGARADFLALAALGEQLIAEQRRRQTPLLDQTEREAALRLDTASWSRWERQTRDHLELTVDADAQELALLAANADQRPATRARIEQLQTRIEQTRARIRDELADIRAVRDEDLTQVGIKQLYLVHETGRAVERDGFGNIIIKPAGDHNPGTYRYTIHFCLNGVVTGHLGFANAQDGHWIVTPLEAVIAANPGTLEVLNAVDTFFVPPAGQPLKLPETSSQIISYRDTPGGDRGVELRRWLTERGARPFDIGAHHSSAGVDARVGHLAQDLGVTANRLHAHMPHGQHEQMLNSASTAAGLLPTLTLSAAALAHMTDNARVRLVAHHRWGAGTAEALNTDPGPGRLG